LAREEASRRLGGTVVVLIKVLSEYLYFTPVCSKTWPISRLSPHYQILKLATYFGTGLVRTILSMHYEVLLRYGPKPALRSGADRFVS
jgi:hypothetical protein